MDLSPHVCPQIAISTHTPRMKNDMKPINPIRLLYHGPQGNTRGSLLFLSLPQIQVL